MPLQPELGRARTWTLELNLWNTSDPERDLQELLEDPPISSTLSNPTTSSSGCLGELLLLLYSDST
jgi:hypothetical protein